MNRIQPALTALAVGVMAALYCGAVSACAVCDALGADLHALPEASEVAGGVGFYSYDAPLPELRPVSSTVPVFNSRPGAHAKLFLDFDGVDFGSVSWSGKMPGDRPAYDLDGDATTFNQLELSRIEQIWSRVSEAYSMFNINVTTEDPGNYNRRESAHIVVSGSNEWYGGGGGVAFIGGFSSTISPMQQRTGWVFPENLRSGDAKVIADAAIHEAGHLFGLRHQSTYDETGTRTDEYDNNLESELRAPNLGVAYNARRGLWAIGSATSGTSTVDEMSVIARTSTNRFGYAPDEAGESFATAEAYTPTSTPQRGVISGSNDSDYYRIDIAEPSRVDLLVDVAEYGPNLDARLALYDASLALLYEDDPTLNTSRASLTASYSGVLQAGSYYLQVASHGGYTYSNGPQDRFLQDAGQYFLSGVIAAGVPEPAAAALGLLLLGLAPRRRRR